MENNEILENEIELQTTFNTDSLEELFEDGEVEIENIEECELPEEEKEEDNDEVSEDGNEN